MRISAARGAQAVVAIVFAGLAIRLFRLTAKYAVNIFFWDQWDFNDATIFEHHSLWEIFRFQHGPHRQGMGGVLSALVEPWFRWNSRTEAFLVTGFVVIACVCLLYFKYRLFGAFSWTDAVIPIVVFTPAQWESVWNTVNLAHGILPVLLIILYCLTWTWHNERIKYALITALNFVTLYTGFGIFLGLITPVLLAVKYRENRAKPFGRRMYLLSCLAISVVSLASFFIAYKHDDASGCTSLFSESPVAYVQFMALMFATPYGIRGTDIFSVAAGACALIGAVVVGAISWKRVLAAGGESRAPHIVLAVWSTYSILFCLFATVGRTCTGLTEAHTSRYGSYRELAVLSLFFGILTLLPPKKRRLLSIVLLLLLIPSLFITPYDAGGMKDLHDVKSGWRDCYLAGHLPQSCDETIGLIYPDNARTHLRQKLEYLRAERLNLFSETPEVRR